ncbi:MAG: DUF433 domain-containing protein [Acidobacteriaceae bacterium]|nr:DUF433 domain-containing protein [Acidobacteriaceae bacterium]
MEVAKIESVDWSACPLISIDKDVMHGEPVFRGTRMPVEDAIENYYAYRELQGMSDEDAIKATLESFPTIPALKVCVLCWPMRLPTSISCNLEHHCFGRGRS